MFEAYFIYLGLEPQQQPGFLSSDEYGTNNWHGYGWGVPHSPIVLPTLETLLLITGTET